MGVHLTKDSIDLGIVVTDPERSLAFYRDVLGFKDAGDDEGAGRRNDVPPALRHEHDQARPSPEGAAGSAARRDQHRRSATATGRSASTTSKRSSTRARRRDTRSPCRSTSSGPASRSRSSKILTATGSSSSRPRALTSRAISTRASLKHAPPARSLKVSGTSALAVSPPGTSRHQMPFGIDTTPGRRSRVEPGDDLGSRPVVPHPHGVTVGHARARRASTGCMRTQASAALNSPNIELMVRCVAGVMSASG